MPTVRCDNNTSRTRATDFETMTVKADKTNSPQSDQTGESFVLTAPNAATNHIEWQQGADNEQTAYSG